MTQTVNASPGRFGYALALVLLLVGFGAFVSALLPATREVRDAVEALQRVMLPASPGLEVTFASPGVVRVYDEQVSLVAGRTVTATGRYEDAAPALVAPDGTPVEAEPIRFSEDSDRTSVLYRVGPYVGESLAQYDLPVAGTYTLRWDGRSPSDARVLAFGQVPVELLKSGFFGVHGGAVACGLCFTAAVMIGLITWARRHPPSRSRHRALGSAA
ncbi:MAG: hypothetical protein AAGE65_09810 [Planctomycetota bacterium]